MKDGAPGIVVRIAGPLDFERVRAGYAEWNYRGGLSCDDVIYLAERGDALLGWVRRRVEHGVVMLRGMRVVPVARRRGIGSRILRAFVADLGDNECWCVPYAHLKGFYGTLGFEVVPDADAPPHLQERVAGYRARGDDMLIMRRPAAAPMPTGREGTRIEGRAHATRRTTREGG
jgi:GNAT superfamily N-acetyltransferase